MFPYNKKEAKNLKCKIFHISFFFFFKFTFLKIVFKKGTPSFETFSWFFFFSSPKN